MRMQNEVAIVTGGERGIGAGIATRFAREGAAIVIGGILEDLGEQTAARIRAAGGRAIFVKTDVSIEQNVKDCVARATKEFGKLTVLVNNAAATVFMAEGGDGPIADLGTEAFDYVQKVGVYGPFWAIKYSIPEMIRAGGGAIVNISSMAANFGLPGQPAYAVSKGGLTSLTRQVAVDYARHDIRANAIMVGVIHDEFTDAAFSTPEGAVAILQIQLARRLGTPDDVANAALYLASREASFVTGATFAVDGGITAKNALRTDNVLADIDQDLKTGI